MCPTPREERNPLKKLVARSHVSWPRTYIADPALCILHRSPGFKHVLLTASNCTALAHHVRCQTIIDLRHLWPYAFWDHLGNVELHELHGSGPIGELRGFAGMGKASSVSDDVRSAQSAVLLDQGQLSELFPDAELRCECVFGLVKSLMGFRLGS